MSAMIDTEVPAEVLVDIVGDVFESLLGEEAGRPYLVPYAEVGTPVSSEIGIDGGWSGRVVLRMPRAMAEHITGTLFALPADLVAESDLRDVIGELINVIGGNVKGMLPGTNALTLPSTDLEPGAETDRTALCLQWAGQPIHISMPTVPTGLAEPTPSGTEADTERSEP